MYHVLPIYCDLFVLHKRTWIVILNRLAGVGMMVPVTNFWWKCVSKDEFKNAFRTQTLMDRVFLRVVHYVPSLTYLFLTHPWIPKANGLQLRPEVVNASDREVLRAISNWPPEKLAEVISSSHSCLQF